MWHRAGHARAGGIIEAMSKSGARRFPVTVTYLPVPRCQTCHRTVAYRPGSPSEVLTEHYRRAHPESLGFPSREPVPAGPRHRPIPAVALLA